MRREGFLAFAAVSFGGMFAAIGWLLVGLVLIRSAFAPTDALLSGPLYPIGVLGPPLAGMMGWLVSMRLALWEARKRGVPPLPRLWARLARPASAAAAIVLGVAWLAGLSYYWVATREGVEVHRFGVATLHAWGDVVTREAGCGRSGKGKFHYAWLTVAFRDGFALDLSSTQQGAATQHFAELSSLTQGAQRSYNGISHYDNCPPGVAAIVLRWP